MTEENKSAEENKGDAAAHAAANAEMASLKAAKREKNNAEMASLKDAAARMLADEPTMKPEPKLYHELDHKTRGNVDRVRAATAKLADAVRSAGVPAAAESLKLFRERIEEELGVAPEKA
jgi:hypothetical protein